MMATRRAVVLVLLMLTATVSSIFHYGCTDTNKSETSTRFRDVSGSGKDTVTIGYACPGLDSAQVAIMEGLLNHAGQRGWEVITANANRDAKVQESQIDYFISLGVDAIVAVPIDSKMIGIAVQKARARDIPFYTIDRSPTGIQINMAVLADNFHAGAQSAQAMVGFLRKKHGKAKGIVLELQGDLRQNVAQLRRAGFHSVVDAYANIQVISKETAWQAARFVSALDETLGQHEIDGIFLHSDAVGIPAILPHLKQLGRLHPRDQNGHIFITGIDGSKQALEAISNGYVDQVSRQPFLDYGIVVDWIAKELDGEQMQECEVVVPGAPWSPAKVIKTELGWELLLSTSLVTIDNLMDKTL